MPELTVSSELYNRFAELSAEFEEFDTAEDLIGFILQDSADELESRIYTHTKEGDDSGEAMDEAAMEDRLKDLGYIQ